MREGTTSRVTAADRPYGEFYDFYGVSLENFGSTHVFYPTFLPVHKILGTSVGSEAIINQLLVRKSAVNFIEAILLCDIIKVYIFMSDTTIIHNSKYYKLIVWLHVTAA